MKRSAIETMQFMMDCHGFNYFPVKQYLTPEGGVLQFVPATMQYRVSRAPTDRSEIVSCADSPWLPVDQD